MKCFLCKREIAPDDWLPLTLKGVPKYVDHVGSLPSHYVRNVTWYTPRTIGDIPVVYIRPKERKP